MMNYRNFTYGRISIIFERNSKKVSLKEILLHFMLEAKQSLKILQNFKRGFL